MKEGVFITENNVTSISKGDKMNQKREIKNMEIKPTDDNFTDIL
jgi:hypothetical protein